MINVGVTGWGDHDDLYPLGVPAREKLRLYEDHFPVVEVDSSFYAVLSRDNYQKWVGETSGGFSFVIKAYQGMTGHARGKVPFASPREMFEAFNRSIDPVVESGKLKAVLFQFPPWFDCNEEHVNRLRAVKRTMGDLPLALEFRHQSWFASGMREKTLAFMKEESWIHVICDEPQIGQGCVPIVLESTHPRLTIIRLHGRNAGGWNQAGAPNWREIRYLYRYNDRELQEWQERVMQLQSKGTDEICMLFNNNSGGDAAANAKQMMSLLGLQPAPWPPRQIDLFGNEMG